MLATSNIRVSKNYQIPSSNNLKANKGQWIIITYAKICSSDIKGYLYFLIITSSANGLLYKIQGFSKADNILRKSDQK